MCATASIHASDRAISRRYDYGEERFVTLGPLGETLVVIVTAETADDIHVISMRKADRHEQTLYRENFR